MRVAVDFSDFSVTRGWNTVYDFGKRIAGFAAFIAFSAAIVPLWSPSQTALQYQLSEHTEELKALKDVPRDIAVIQGDIHRLQDQEHQNAEGISRIDTRQLEGMAGALACVVGWIFNMLGGKFFKKE